MPDKVIATNFPRLIKHRCWKPKNPKGCKGKNPRLWTPQTSGSPVPRQLPKVAGRWWRPCSKHADSAGLSHPTRRCPAPKVVSANLCL